MHHDGDCSELDISHVIELQYNWISLTAVYARMRKEVLINPQLGFLTDRLIAGRYACAMSCGVTSIIGRSTVAAVPLEAVLVTRTG